MLGGIGVHVVEPGTEIEYEGETIVVTDTQAVFRGLHLYVTQAQYDAIKAQAEEPKK